MSLSPILQVFALLVAVATPVTTIYIFRSQKPRTEQEVSKIKADAHSLIEDAVRKHGDFLSGELEKIRVELDRERKGRRDCDEHLAVTKTELRDANTRIDLLTIEIARVRTDVNQNSSRINEFEKDTNQ